MDPTLENLAVAFPSPSSSPPTAIKGLTLFTPPKKIPILSQLPRFGFVSLCAHFSLNTNPTSYTNILNFDFLLLFSLFVNYLY